MLRHDSIIFDLQYAHSTIETMACAIVVPYCSNIRGLGKE